MGQPSQNRLKEILEYNAETGQLFYKFCRNCGAPKNEVKVNHAEGYRVVGIDGKNYLAHRMIWIMVYGRIDPKKHIDHIDRDRANNRLANLRLVTQQENNKNRSFHPNRYSGVCGISYNIKTSKWVAQINVVGKNKNLGEFIEIEDAKKARQEAEQRYGYHPNHGRVLPSKAA